MWALASRGCGWVGCCYFFLFKHVLFCFSMCRQGGSWFYMGYWVKNLSCNAAFFDWDVQQGCAYIQGDVLGDDRRGFLLGVSGPLLDSIVILIPASAVVDVCLSAVNFKTPTPFHAMKGRLPAHTHVTLVSRTNTGTMKSRQRDLPEDRRARRMSDQTYKGKPDLCPAWAVSSFRHGKLRIYLCVSGRSWKSVHELGERTSCLAAVTVCRLFIANSCFRSPSPEGCDHRNEPWQNTLTCDDRSEEYRCSSSVKRLLLQPQIKPAPSFVPCTLNATSLEMSYPPANTSKFTKSTSLSYLSPALGSTPTQQRSRAATSTQSNWKRERDQECKGALVAPPKSDKLSHASTSKQRG